MKQLMIKQKNVLIRTLLFILFLFTSSSYAIDVLPGGSSTLSGTTFAANPDLGGSAQSDLLLPFQIFDGGGSLLIEGVLQDRVILSTNLNTMIFAPRLRNISGVAGSRIIRLTVEGYTGFTTDIDYRTDGLGNLGPNSVDRATGAGDLLSFNYNPNQITPPNESLFISILTNAPQFFFTGRVTIYAQDTAGNTFSTVLNNTVSPSKPTVRIQSTANASEPNTNGSFQVVRTGDTANALTVQYSIAGTASSGIDYTALSGSIIIPSGSSTAIIPVTVLDDLIIEATESVIVTITNDVAYQIDVNSSSATVNISDNETAEDIPTLSEWSILLLIFSLGIFGLYNLRKQ